MNKKNHKKKSPNPKYTPDQQEMDADLDTYAALDEVAKSAGGKIIIDAAINDVMNAIDALSNRYKTETHAGLIALCADLSVKINLIQMLTRAENQKDGVQKILEESLRVTEQ